MPILWPLKVPERGNGKTQRKTLEIEHSCLFIHHTIWIYPFPHLILFNTPKKSLLKLSYPSQIFVPKKIPESKISNPRKSFDHPRHLKSPWGEDTFDTILSQQLNTVGPLHYRMDYLNLRTSCHWGGVLPYICLIGNECAAPMGMVFAPFYSENG